MHTFRPERERREKAYMARALIQTRDFSWLCARFTAMIIRIKFQPNPFGHGIYLHDIPRPQQSEQITIIKANFCNQLAESHRRQQAARIRERLKPDNPIYGPDFCWMRTILWRAMPRETAELLESTDMLSYMAASMSQKAMVLSPTNACKGGTHQRLTARRM